MILIDFYSGERHKRENRPGKGGLSNLKHTVNMNEISLRIGDKPAHGNTKHGFNCHRGGKKRAPEYSVWSTMIQRCHNPNDKNFPNYGGRGISVCKEWRETFSAFIACLGERPSPKHCIERLNNDGNYEPDNCAWVTRKEQNRNRRMKRILVIDGRSKSLIEWSEESKIPYGIIRNRLRYGWTHRDSVFTPVRAILKYEKRL